MLKVVNFEIFKINPNKLLFIEIELNINRKSEQNIFAEEIRSIFVIYHRRNFTMSNQNKQNQQNQQNQKNEQNQNNNNR